MKKNQTVATKKEMGVDSFTEIKSNKLDSICWDRSVDRYIPQKKTCSLLQKRVKQNRKAWINCVPSRHKLDENG